MFGSHFPVAYVVKRVPHGDPSIPRQPHERSWWLRTIDENTGARYWTGSTHKAHIFSSKSLCEDFVNKYFPDGSAKVDERILNPWSFIGG